MNADAALAEAWGPRLRALAERIRERAGGALRAALAKGSLASIDRPVSRGAGDVTFGLDRPTEAALSDWLREEGARAPLSLLTEDAGWRHFGPSARADGGTTELDGFDHGGPRIVIDPIDGTRNLMADLRSAWTAIALCGPGDGRPRLSDVRGALLAELPDSRAARFRVLAAVAGRGARFELREVERGGLVESRALAADADARCDHGYFPVFCYAPAMRPRIAALATDFFARLEREEGAALRHCYDDQYISNAGQLALLALGTYRFVADVRARVLERDGGPSITSKPYDCAGAILVAREAGCRVRDASGGELDFPLDATTPVDFVGYANEATRARLEPHWLAALAEARLDTRASAP